VKGSVIKFRVLRAAVASCLAATAACSGEHRPAPGEVVVIVTSDLSVPADMDTLRWTVSGVGRATTVLTGSRALTPDSLPGTLAVISGPETNGHVLVRLEGLSGGPGGRVQVLREAELTSVPSHGAKALSMPLNWLCGAANLGAPCPDGTTCVAGSCQPFVIDPSTLPDYEPLESGACFDVLGCFGTNSPVQQTVPVQDPSGRCLIPADKSPFLVEPAVLNVALVVDTSLTGSSGTCTPGGACVIPLATGAPEGWDPIVDDAGPVGLGLPSKVCELGIPVQITGACATKVASASLCPAKPTCARSDVTCPSDWYGYSCAALTDGGSAYPDGIDPTRTDCWPGRASNLDSGAGGTSTLLCCATPPAPPADPLLIDDMTGEPELKLVPPISDEVAGYWSDFTVGPAALLTPPRDFFQYTSIAPPAAAPDGGAIPNAACFDVGYPFSGSLAAENFNYAMNSGAAAPFDVRAYTGIRFLAWSEFTGQPVEVDFPDIDTDTESASSTCNRLTRADAGDAGCGDHYAKALVLSDTPTEYVVRWAELRQSGASGVYQAPAFDQAHVIGTFFGVSHPGPDPYPLPIHICVADVYFTR
jgi:hypothetical protein